VFIELKSKNSSSAALPDLDDEQDDLNGIVKGMPNDHGADRAAAEIVKPHHDGEEKGPCDPGWALVEMGPEGVEKGVVNWYRS